MFVGLLNRDGTNKEPTGCETAGGNRSYNAHHRICLRSNKLGGFVRSLTLFAEMLAKSFVSLEFRWSSHFLCKILDLAGRMPIHWLRDLTWNNQLVSWSEFSTRKTCDLCTQGSLGLLSASSKPPASLALLHSDQPRKNNTSWTSAAPLCYKCMGLDGCLGGVTSKEHLAVLINLGREISSQLFPTDTWAHSRQ